MSGVNQRHNYKSPPDGGWGWIVVIGSFVCMFIVFGFIRNLGLFVEQLVNDFESSTGPIGFIVSMPITLLLITGPISGILCKRYGSRLTCVIGAILISIGLAIAYSSTNGVCLAIGIGVLPGLGLGLAYTANVVIVSRYFENMFVVANGLIFLGGPISFLIFPIVGETLIEEYGWRRTILMWCAMALHIIVGGLLMRPVYLLRDLDDTQTNMKDYELLDVNQQTSSEELSSSTHTTGMHTSNTRPSANRYIFKMLKNTATYFELQLFRENMMFVLIMGVIFLNGFSYESWLIFVIPQAIEMDITEARSALIITIAGIGSIIGRLSQIGILHWNILSTYNTWVFANVLAAIALIMDPLFHNEFSLITFSIVYGIATGIKIPLAPVLVRDFVGIEKIHVALGWLNLSRGLGALAGGTTMGVLHNYYGSYRQPFIVVAAVQTIAAIILIFKLRDSSSYIKTNCP